MGVTTIIQPDAGKMYGYLIPKWPFLAGATDQGERCHASRRTRPQGANNPLWVGGHPHVASYLLMTLFSSYVPGASW
ncbi:MAG: hypothetical protein Q8R28_03765 [Dehalococcoidia bacterium]|nr:hypothetical protein [Dehalococcoidia bacterium]